MARETLGFVDLLSFNGIDYPFCVFLDFYGKLCFVKQSPISRDDTNLPGTDVIELGLASADDSHTMRVSRQQAKLLATMLLKFCETGTIDKVDPVVDPVPPLKVP